MTDPWPAEQSSPSRREKLLLAALLAAALCLRVAGAWTDYPWCWYPDRDVVIHARNCINPKAPKLCPGEYIYPTGYIYLNAAVYALLGAAMAPFIGLKGVAHIYYNQVGFLAAVTRIVGSVMACGAVALLWWMARTLFGRMAGWLAALVLSVAWLDIVCSHYPTTDVAAAFALIATCAWALRTYLRGPSLRAALFGGALAGAAAATKYPAGAGLIAVLLAVVMNDRSPAQSTGERKSESIESLDGQGGQPSSPPTVFATAWHHKTACLIAAVAAAAVVFFLLMPWAILDWPNFLADMTYQAVYNKTGPLPPWQVWKFWLTATPAAGMGWPLNVLALVGLARLSVARPRHAAIILVPPLLVFLSFASTTRFMPRWYEAIMPFVALGAGVGLAWVLHIGHHVPGWRQWSTAITISLLAGPLLAAVYYDAILMGPGSRRAVTQWVTERIPQGADVALFQWLWAGPAIGEDSYRLAWYIPGSLERLAAGQRMEEILRDDLGAALKASAPKAYQILKQRAAKFTGGARSVADLLPSLPHERWVVVNVSYWMRMINGQAHQTLAREYQSAIRRYWGTLQAHLAAHYVERARFGQLGPQHPWDEWPYGSPLIVVYERTPEGLQGRTASEFPAPPSRVASNTIVAKNLAPALAPALRARGAAQKSY